MLKLEALLCCLVFAICLGVATLALCQLARELGGTELTVTAVASCFVGCRMLDLISQEHRNAWLLRASLTVWSIAAVMHAMQPIAMPQLLAIANGDSRALSGAYVVAALVALSIELALHRTQTILRPIVASKRAADALRSLLIQSRNESHVAQSLDEVHLQHRFDALRRQLDCLAVSPTAKERS